MVTAASLQVSGGGQIATDTAGEGPAGNVLVEITGQTMMDSTGSTSFTGISSRSNSSAAGGNAGGVTVNTGSLSIQNGAASVLPLPERAWVAT